MSDRVCVIAVFFINGFTWGIVAVSMPPMFWKDSLTDSSTVVFRCLPCLLHQQQCLRRRDAA
jgi:hypothetical protein